MERRLVRLITRLNVGGPARQALALTHALAPQWRTVLAAGHPDASEGELSDPRVVVERVPLVRPIDPRTDARAVRSVRQLLTRERPHIVHTHMAKAGAVGRIASRFVGERPRTVHTFHGHVLDGYFGPVARHAFVNIERMLARSTDVLVAVSEEVRDDLLEFGIGRPSQYRVIRLGLDLADYRQVAGRSGALRRDLGVGDDELLVGTVGRLVPIKDHELLLQAFAETAGCRLAVVGDGELRTHLEARARALGVADRVYFTGWRQDIPAVMSDLDLVVLSSRNEGTPVSLIEAAAVGRAAVATDVGGVRTVVEDGVTGLVVPHGSVAALAQAMRSLLASSARRDAMGLAARERSHRFDLQRLVGDIRDLYDELAPIGDLRTVRRGRRRPGDALPRDLA